MERDQFYSWLLIRFDGTSAQDRSSRELSRVLVAIDFLLIKLPELSIACDRLVSAQWKSSIARYWSIRIFMISSFHGLLV